MPVAVLLLATGCGSSTPKSHHTATSAVSPAPATTTPPGGGASASTRPPRPPKLDVTTLRWRLPVAVAREAVSVRGQRLLAAGGLVSGDRSTPDAYLLDPRSGTTTRLAALQVPVHDTAGARVAGRSLVIGGGSASEQDVVQARHTGRGWSTIGRLPQARSDLSALVAGGRVVVLGGYDANTPAVPSIIASANGRDWSRIGTLPVPVRYAASAVLGTTVWMFGGERSGAEQTAVQQVDASSGVARVVARLPHPLGHATAVVLGNRVLLVGGRTSTSAISDQMWWFDPTTRAFSRAGRLPTPLADSAIATIGDTAYLLGGESPNFTDRVVRLVLH